MAWSIANGPCFLTRLDRIGPFDTFHDQVMDAVLLAGVVRRDDVRVRQPGGSLDLALGSGGRTTVLSCRRTNHFQSDDAFHSPMLRLENLPHAADAEFIEHQVLAEHQSLGFAQRQPVGLEAWSDGRP